MQKHLLILLCGLPLVVSAKPERTTRNCSHLMVVVDNTQRYVHPEVPRLFQRLQTERFFNAITWQDYADGRPLFSRRLRATDNGQVLFLMTLQTAQSEAGFQRRSEVITPEMKAELVIEMRPVGPKVMPAIVSGIRYYSDFSSPVNPFWYKATAGGFLTSSDLRRIAQVSSVAFGDTPLTERGRIGDWIIRDHSAQIRISLDHLTHAEFASFINAVASRADERTLPDDDVPGSSPP